MTTVGDESPDWMPRPGTRARTRQLGYADAMYEIFQMLAEACQNRPWMEPLLGPLRRHAYTCWMLADSDMLFNLHLHKAGLRPELPPASGPHPEPGR